MKVTLIEYVLAGKGARIFLNEHVEEGLWLPVGAQRVPEACIHDVDAVLECCLFFALLDIRWLRIGSWEQLFRRMCAPGCWMTICND
jgi:hypothetical protein